MSSPFSCSSSPSVLPFQALLSCNCTLPSHFWRLQNVFPFVFGQPRIFQACFRFPAAVSVFSCCSWSLVIRSSTILDAHNMIPPLWISSLASVICWLNQTVCVIETFFGVLHEKNLLFVFNRDTAPRRMRVWHAHRSLDCTTFGIGERQRNVIQHVALHCSLYCGWTSPTL